MPRLRHYNHLGTGRFVTFSCFHRYQLLTTPDDMRVVLRVLSTLRSKHELCILGYVIMAEHVHLVVTIPDNVRLGSVVGELKSCSARRVLSKWRARGSRTLPGLYRRDTDPPEYQFWQPRCYDHNCRAPETVLEKIKGCHENPVKRGLVKASEVWPSSSYRWHHGLAGVELEIDGYKS